MATEMRYFLHEQFGYEIVLTLIKGMIEKS